MCTTEKYSHTLLHNTITLSVANDKRYAREHIEITKYDEDPENTGLEDSAKRLQDAAEPLQFREEQQGEGVERG